MSNEYEYPDRKLKTGEIIGTIFLFAGIAVGLWTDLSFTGVGLVLSALFLFYVSDTGLRVKTLRRIPPAAVSSVSESGEVVFQLRYTTDRALFESTLVRTILCFIYAGVMCLSWSLAPTFGTGSSASIYLAAALAVTATVFFGLVWKTTGDYHEKLNRLFMKTTDREIITSQKSIKISLALVHVPWATRSVEQLESEGLAVSDGYLTIPWADIKEFRVKSATRDWVTSYFYEIHFSHAGKVIEITVNREPLAGGETKFLEIVRRNCEISLESPVFGSLSA